MSQFFSFWIIISWLGRQDSLIKSQEHESAIEMASTSVVVSGCGVLFWYFVFRSFPSWDCGLSGGSTFGLPVPLELWPSSAEHYSDVNRMVGHNRPWWKPLATEWGTRSYISPYPSGLYMFLTYLLLAKFCHIEN